jgi:hypothetical protein
VSISDWVSEKLTPAVGPMFHPSPKLPISTRSGSMRALASVPNSAALPVGALTLSAMNGCTPLIAR